MRVKGLVVTVLAVACVGMAVPSASLASLTLLGSPQPSLGNGLDAVVANGLGGIVAACSAPATPGTSVQVCKRMPPRYGFASPQTAVVVANYSTGLDPPTGVVVDSGGCNAAGVCMHGVELGDTPLIGVDPVMP